MLSEGWCSANIFRRKIASIFAQKCWQTVDWAKLNKLWQWKALNGKNKEPVEVWPPTIKIQFNLSTQDHYDINAISYIAPRPLTYLKSQYCMLASRQKGHHQKPTKRPSSKPRKQMLWTLATAAGYLHYRMCREQVLILSSRYFFVFPSLFSEGRHTLIYPIHGWPFVTLNKVTVAPCKVEPAGFIIWVFLLSAFSHVSVYLGPNTGDYRPG